jgi:prophage regulatory protein
MSHQLPSTGFLRLPQIIGNRRTDPPTPAIIPISKSQLWLMVKQGRFPRPVKLGERCTAWTVESVRQWIADQARG